jgi:multicomponent Na+:H+ antiporter subunit E
MNIYVLGVVFVTLWLAVTGSWTVPNLLFGMLISAISLGLIRRHLDDESTYWRRPLAILSLTILFFKELALSAWKVAVLVTRREINIQPGIFAYPLRVTTDFEITLLANLITLTPGTLSVDVSEDRKFLYVHGIDCADVEGAKADIANGFEQKIMEAFRK